MQRFCVSRSRVTPYFGMSLFIICFLPIIANPQVTIAFDINNQPVSFGVSRIEKALQQSGQQVQKIKLSSAQKKANIVIEVNNNKQQPRRQKEGFEIANRNNTLLISAIDTAGAMYGALDVAEQSGWVKLGKVFQAKK